MSVIQIHHIEGAHARKDDEGEGGGREEEVTMRKGVCVCVCGRGLKQAC